MEGNYEPTERQKDVLIQKKEREKEYYLEMAERCDEVITELRN